MKKVYLAAMVFLCIGLGACSGRINDDFNFYQCLARDRTSNPCN